MAHAWVSIARKSFTNEAINFITANQNNPFFVYLAYTAPHYLMHVPPQEYLNTYNTLLNTLENDL
ncbi:MULTISPECIES: sulfatase-like hydrolase/transferase [unclassified Lentimonas]|uniref:sulfatase-like hydrolase/transferase n=1 Tax=unclassified Lentimonas TaxID=2630993 RepID=UPI00132A1078|nr:MULTISPECIES: sulfatase-like hydrolase/transferase [unclassified Lentimonas]CAA6679337.1 Unannotated [Lentimonas sp. CC4]CAA6686374.1 Unannotated [Lentimonas sp. CC6]CAA7076148.1 Unannotated [Lentimonas sp. CC4]CAA7170859.1 Unannotated [Lentimonas sp. CC21]CAA7181199.1 Unannotated [Lentimonas sp. CC8]